MRLRKYFSIVLFITAASIYTMLLSCKGSCSRCFGCTYLQAVRKTDSSILLQRQFCTQTSTYTDQAYNDSISQFYMRYTSDTTLVARRDSTYGCSQMSVKGADMPSLEAQGYYCQQYK